MRSRCVVRSGSVTVWWSKVLFCTTTYYSALRSTLLQYYCSTSLWYKVLLQYYSVLQSATPVLLCNTKVLTYYSSTTLYCKVLLQYYKVLLQYCSVLQSATPVLLSTTKYCKVLLQYYSVLQSTSPVPLCTTKHHCTTTLLLCITKDYSSTTLYYKPRLCTTKCHSSTILYYKVLLRTTPVLLCTTKYSALQSTPPVLLCNTKCYSSTTLYYKVALMISNLTKYCTCHEKSLSWLKPLTYEASCTVRGATWLSLQPHQTLHLPRNMTLMIDPAHIKSCAHKKRYLRVEQKLLNRGLHCEGPGVCNYQSRLKFFPEMAKGNFYWLKMWRKFRYIWYVYLSRPMFKSMFTRKEGHGNPEHMTFVAFVFPWHQGPGHFVKVSVKLKNAPIYYRYRLIFRESLAKV